MKTKSKNLLPKTVQEINNGSIHAQSVRCGRQNCKCSRGDTHTAFYFFSRRNGKLTKTYIRQSELKDFSRLVERAKQERRHQRRLVRKSTNLLKSLRASVKECENLTNLYKKHHQGNHLNEQN